MTFQKLKEYVGARLDALTTISIYSKEAPENAVFPYVVFSFPSSSITYNLRDDRICELNFWDDSYDSSGIQTAIEAIKAGFNLYWQTESSGFYRSDLIFEGEIPEVRPNITRYQQRYLLKVR